jgi:hypothetical protein
MLLSRGRVVNHLSERKFFAPQKSKSDAAHYLNRIALSLACSRKLL